MKIRILEKFEFKLFLKNYFLFLNASFNFFENHTETPNKNITVETVNKIVIIVEVNVGI